MATRNTSEALGYRSVFEPFHPKCTIASQYFLTNPIRLMNDEIPDNLARSIFKSFVRKCKVVLY